MWATPSSTFAPCYSKSGGALRVIDGTVTKCGKSETALAWNVQGPQGEKGETGAQGVQGAPGMSGYEIVTKTHSDPNAIGVSGSESASCPTGKKVVGGGVFIGRLADGSFSWTTTRVVSSFPSSDSAWTAAYDATGLDGGFKRTVYAICVSVASP